MQFVFYQIFIHMHIIISIYFTFFRVILFEPVDMLLRDVMVKKIHNTANCVESMKLSTIISFKILIQNFEGVAILGHVIDGVNIF